MRKIRFIILGLSILLLAGCKTNNLKKLYSKLDIKADTTEKTGKVNDVYVMYFNENSQIDLDVSSQNPETIQQYRKIVESSFAMKEIYTQSLTGYSHLYVIKINGIEHVYEPYPKIHLPGYSFSIHPMSSIDLKEFIEEDSALYYQVKVLKILEETELSKIKYDEIRKMLSKATQMTPLKWSMGISAQCNFEMFLYNNECQSLDDTLKNLTKLLQYSSMDLKNNDINVNLLEIKLKYIAACLLKSDVKAVQKCVNTITYSDNDMNNLPYNLKPFYYYICKEYNSNGFKENIFIEVFTADLKEPGSSKYKDYLLNVLKFNFLGTL